MKRGELYRVFKPGGDTKQHRTFVVVSRQTLVDSKFPSLVCAAVMTEGQGLATQVAIGIDEGMKRECWIPLRRSEKHAKKHIDTVGRIPLARQDAKAGLCANSGA